jgi:hypothetical protein
MSEHDDAFANPADDWLERALRENAVEHRAAYVADDGFTARVAEALPPQPTLPAWRKPAVAALWTTAAVGVALALPDTLSALLNDVVRLLPRHPVSLVDVAAGIGVLALASWSAAVYALRRW